ncbi:T-complex protein 1 subunit alpha-like isoform X2 [Vicia villosa]|uniref:T-complex protein 1 subunit alpha-like isoform X2 n=1 Tax=Vicia villosa TaxID=3911 RepID=UPI00273BAFE2|nr:T-complex protein 1 subunit alpha-like isoform X2 [Vicia villosa]
MPSHCKHRQNLIRSRRYVDKIRDSHLLHIHIPFIFHFPTILKMLEVEHPAAKVLVELAELQDREVGDGTTSVVIVAARLLKRANDLVRNKIHPTSIISGYRLAMREACKYIDEKLAVKVEKLGKDSLVNCAKTSMSSKLISGDSDYFENLINE